MGDIRWSATEQGPPSKRALNGRDKQLGPTFSAFVKQRYLSPSLPPSTFSHSWALCPQGHSEIWRGRDINTMYKSSSLVGE